jgi:hypothetical protein
MITSIKLYFLLLGPFIEDISISLWNLGISEANLGILDLRGQQCDDYISGVGPRDFPECAFFYFYPKPVRNLFLDVGRIIVRSKPIKSSDSNYNIVVILFLKSNLSHHRSKF